MAASRLCSGSSLDAGSANGLPLKGNGGSPSRSSGGNPPPPPSPPPPGGPTDPALPTLLSTQYSPPTGATINVPAGGNFQTALNNAQPGDQIVLAAGATYTGNFTLPVKTGSSWI